MSRPLSPTRAVAGMLAAGLLLSACGSASPAIAPAALPSEPAAITLLTHDSFNLSEDVLAAFTAETGIKVEILRGGDAGAVLSQAILTGKDPLGDVLFGLDNISLQLALDAKILAPHPTALPADVNPAYDLDPTHRAVPIDTGDVCLNYDKEAFATSGARVPTTMADLLDDGNPARLVVENPSTSSPGLAFLLATIAAFGENGWEDFWQALRDGDVAISSGWEDAYYGQFSGGAGEGDRPLVVSYASSPPAEVLFGEDPESLEAPTGVILGSCYRQVEFAGTLAGTEHPAEAAAFVDFLLSDAVQEDIPLQMFVFPVRDVTLPEVFVRHAKIATDPFELDPSLVAANREDWIATWVDLMLR